MKTMYLKTLSAIFTLGSLLTLSSCKDDDPKKEDVPELITQVVLTFNKADGVAEPIVITATDPDGDGVLPVTIDDDIRLASNTTYTLKIQLHNTLAEPTDDAYNITAEVEEEGDEHMFFFGWTNNVFTDPAGDGNVDTRTDAVNYEGAGNSIDANGLPLGLTTTWTTAATGTGTFRLLLKHQPELKSETSNSNTGETDLDVTFGLEILE